LKVGPHRQVEPDLLLGGRSKDEAAWTQQVPRLFVEVLSPGRDGATCW
jgi:hypothetical protein